MKPRYKAAKFHDQSADPGTRFETEYLIQDTRIREMFFITATHLTIFSGVQNYLLTL